ncbi:hypothetical protein [Colwellia ponticola]|uniref:hypothetical protein n=1 Tax=Colwellia ponticola TaxID=2304625 RepID=UPI001CA46CAE|nr:hypothetical protein [Colwellia ponticola]
MSITVGQSGSVAAQSTSTQSSSGAELLTAALSKKQQEAEGQMALQLIQSASAANVPAPSGNSGFQVNIKV